MIYTKHNIDIENSVLAHCLYHNDRIEDCVNLGISENSFFSENNKVVWSTIIELSKIGLAVDEVILMERLETKFNDKGNPLINNLGSVLVTITKNICSQAVFEAHSKKLLELELERNFSYTCSEIYTLAQDGEEPVEARVSEAEGKIMSLSEKSVQGGVVRASEITNAVVTRIDKINRREQEHGLSTGFQSVDDQTGRLRPCNMITLAARPGLGKTSFAMNIADNVCAAGGNVLVFSLEMSKDQLMQRMVFSRSKVKSNLMADGLISPFQMGLIHQARRDIDAMGLFICDDPNVNILRIKSFARSVNRKHPLDLIIIDYVQLIKPLGGGRNREREVAEISSGVVGLAKETGVPILSLAQISRESEKEKRWPRKSDLRESGALEQDSHIVMFLSDVGQNGAELPWTPAGQEIDLIVAKNRDWQVGSCKLLFNGGYTRFSNFTNTQQTEQRLEKHEPADKERYF